VTEHDPDQEAVRRLLGEVPPAGPVPDDVAARLDARLAELVAEREAAIVSPVAETGDDELAQARRRRRFRIALVAAASVSVLGLGLGTVLDDLSPGGVAGSADSASAGDGGGETMARELEEDTAGPAEAPTDGSPRIESDSTDETAGAVRPVVRRATLEADVTRIAEDQQALRDNDGGRSGVAQLVAPCAVPPMESGDRAVPITFEGKNATLVVRAPEGGTREAEIYACDARGGPLTTAPLPSR
jgi:hypothetical protein